MKKTIFLILILTICFSMSVYADNAIKVEVNDIPLSFDTPPTLVNGRTLVPLRSIFEALGAQITWNGETQTVVGVKGNTTITIRIGDKFAKVNDKTIELDVAGTIINGRTMVPVRFISESLSADVNWRGEDNTVQIHTRDVIGLKVYGEKIHTKVNPIVKNNEVYIPLEDTVKNLEKYISINFDEKANAYDIYVSGYYMFLPIKETTIKRNGDQL